MAGSGTSGLFGTPKQVAVERGLAEFRSGRPVIVTSAGERVVALPVDGMSDQRLAAFRLLCAPGRPHLLVTARRARALGLDAAGPTGLAIGDLHDAAAIFSLAARAQVARHLEVVAVGETAPAAIELAKLAQLLPALLVADASTAAVDANERYAALVTWFREQWNAEQRDAAAQEIFDELELGAGARRSLLESERFRALLDEPAALPAAA